MKIEVFIDDDVINDILEIHGADGAANALVHMVTSTVRVQAQNLVEDHLETKKSFDS